MNGVSALPPEVGQAVRVRNRLATVLSVQPYDSKEEEGRLNLVEVEYLDDCRHPKNDLLLWEAETTALDFGNHLFAASRSVDPRFPQSTPIIRPFPSVDPAEPTAPHP